MISIIIPSYNHDKYIKKAVNSVLNQSHKDLELIVVDDGSQDGSVSYLSTVRDVRFKLIVQENQGAHHAINRGLSEATGEYVAILNSDDNFELQRFDQMIKAMKNSGSEFSCSWINLIDENDNRIGLKKGWTNCFPKWVHEYRDGNDSKNEFLENLIISNFTSTTSNMVIKRSLYDELGGFINLRFVHDWDFALRASLKTNPICINNPLMNYRLHSTNTIKSDYNWMMFEVCWIRAFYQDRIIDTLYPNSELPEDFKRLLSLDEYDVVVDALIEYAKASDNFEKSLLCLLDDENLRKPFIDQVGRC
ncbi:glycosyltransferase [Bizionia sp.]|uniref:glycosyltransferase n=1 Tax=Bizionia sp. TaxID=1954480 RepID=UPI003A909219